MSRVPHPTPQAQLAERARAAARAAAEAAEAEAAAERSRRILQRANDATEALFKYLPLLLGTPARSVTITDIIVRDDTGETTAILPCVEVEPGVWLTGDSGRYHPGRERLFLHFGQPTMHTEDAWHANNENYYPWHIVCNLADLGTLLERGSVK